MDLDGVGGAHEMNAGVDGLSIYELGNVRHW